LNKQPRSVKIKDLTPYPLFEKIQVTLKDNYAEYDRNKSRGCPRPGSALLHGLVYCGECGHKMVVQYKNSSRYICNALRQQWGSPVCQYIPADAVDKKVVESFFAALSPAEIDVYSRALEQKKQGDEQISHAKTQQIERLRYEAALAKRQYMKVDPENRLVALELEKRWEAALRDLKQTEDSMEQLKLTPATPLKITAELKEAFSQLGRKLPAIWNTDALSREHKKSLIRCLVDKVIIHRQQRDQIHIRIVWRGGTTSSFDIPIPVGSFAELNNSKQMESRIVELSQQGKPDKEIAKELTAEGYRSPMGDHMLPSTIQGIRLKHGIMRKRSQSHLRRIDGYLTVPQLAKTLDIPRHWIYDRIHKGVINVNRDTQTGLYLFPDRPDTIEQFRKLQAGTIDKMGC
jgi:DNA-binding NarL/FixJ family response regulator